MFQVSRLLGRLVHVQAPPQADPATVLRLQHDLNTVLRRVGEPAVVVVDLSELAAIPPAAVRTLVLVLAGGPPLARVVVVADRAGVVAPALADLDAPGRVLVERLDAMPDALADVGRRAERHAAWTIVGDRKAA